MWEPMTIDEYAEFQQRTGLKVTKVGDTWWAEPRPFFFRPLFPLAQVPPEPGNHPARSRLGGVMHPVPDRGGNSFMHLFLYDEPQAYSVDTLNSKHRQTIRRALRDFTPRRLTDKALFVDEACGIYHSFYQRTRYFHQKERLDRKRFAAWAEPLFDNPKVVVMALYREEKLAAVETAYQVEDVIIEDVYFSDTESQGLQVTDAMVHTIREAAKASSARFIFRGYPSGKKSLDQSKIMRDCKVMRLPAYVRINPVVLCLVKRLMPQGYRKLMAMTSLCGLDPDGIRFVAP